MGNEEVTSLISRNINSGHEKEYDDWLRRYLAFERNAPGYLGTTIILPGGSSSTLRYIINRFTDKAHMVAWESSQDAQNLLDEVNHYSTRYYEKATGLETWFSLPDLKRTLLSLLDGKWLLSYSLRRMRLARFHDLFLILF